MALTVIIVGALVTSTFAAPISNPVLRDVDLLGKRVSSVCVYALEMLTVAFQDVAYLSSQHHASLTSVTKSHTSLRKYRARPAYFGLESIFDAFDSGSKRYKSTGTLAQKPLAHTGSGLPVLQVQTARAKYLHSSGKAHKHSRRAVPEKDKDPSGEWAEDDLHKYLEEWEWTKSSSEQSNDNSLVHEERSSKCPPNRPERPWPSSLFERFLRPLNTGCKPPRKASKRSLLPADMEVTSFGQGVMLVRHRPVSSGKQEVLPAKNQVLHRRQLVPGNDRSGALPAEEDGAAEWLGGVKSSEEALSKLTPATRVKV